MFPTDVLFNRVLPFCQKLQTGTVYLHQVYIKWRNRVTEEHEVLKTTYGKKDLSISRIFECLLRVRECRGDVEGRHSQWTNESDLHPTSGGEHVHSALERSPIDTQKGIE